MLPQQVIVEVRNANLQRVGALLPGERKLRGTPVFNGVGSWSLEVPGEHRLAVELRKPGAGLIVTGPDDVWWSGPVTTPGLEAGTRDPRGTLKVSGVTDDVVLADAAAWPQPSNANVATQTTANDERTGPAETLMHAFVNANIGPGAPAARRGRLAQALTLAANQGRGPALTKKPRFDNLGVLLGEIGTYAGLGFRVVQRGSVLVFEVFQPTDRTKLIRLDVRNGGITSQNVTTSPPAVTRVIVAGQGEGVERVLVQRTNATATAAEQAWGRIIERFKDQRQEAEVAKLQQAGDEDLADGGFTATNVSVLPGSEIALQFGRDWKLGDRAAVVVEGQETATTITQATVLEDNKGLRVGMGIGDVAGFNPTAALEGRVEDTAQRVSALERTVETPADMNELLEQVRGLVNVGTWQAFTPLWFDGWTPGTNETFQWRYAVVGKTVHVRFRIVFGTGVDFWDRFLIALPMYGVTPNQQGIGLAFANDTGSGLTPYVGAIYIRDGDHISIRDIPGGAANFGQWGYWNGTAADNPFTWAAGDTLEGSFTYETTGVMQS